jgi:molybdate transport system regulatory protein
MIVAGENSVMVKVRFRLDFAPGSSVGPGKIDLLAAIDAEGSLSAAARQIGMSYRRAWLLLDSLNRGFATPTTTASVGGSGGGGVALTAFGRELVRQYRAFDVDIERLAQRRWAPLARSARALATGGAGAAKTPNRAGRSGPQRRRARTRS